MSRHDDRVCLQDMLAHAREAIALIGESSPGQFERDRVAQLAATRLVEIVGEAARRVSLATQQAHPDIPWAGISGMRNRVARGYDVIDLDLLWNTVIRDLPPLAVSLEALLEDR